VVASGTSFRYLLIDRPVRAYPECEPGAEGLKMAGDVLFRDLYERYHRHVYAYCRRRTSADAVDDAVSDTFLIAWRRSDQVPLGDEALPWLYGVAFRVLAHQWRSAARRGRLAEKLASLGVSTVSLPEDLLILGHEHRQVLKALGGLRRTDQEILRLTVWEELTQTEIAVVLDIRPAAVGQRLYVARKKLADEYKRLENRPVRSRAAEKGGLL
jgi:RNA polymerase sigma-70 factor (ECF subfamily)